MMKKYLPYFVLVAAVFVASCVPEVKKLSEDEVIPDGYGMVFMSAVSTSKPFSGGFWFHLKIRREESSDAMELLSDGRICKYAVTKGYSLASMIARLGTYENDIDEKSGEETLCGDVFGGLLAAGVYEVDQVTTSNADANNQAQFVDYPVGKKVTFEVRPGEVVYLGSFKYSIVELLLLGKATRVSYQFEDAFDRDSKIFDRQYPKVKDAKKMDRAITTELKEWSYFGD